MNPIRLKTHIDKYRVYTIYMPSMFKWFTLASDDKLSLNSVGGFTDSEAFANHLRIASIYREKVESEQDLKLVAAVKDIIVTSENEAAKTENYQDDDTEVLINEI